ncbi:MAG: hypothetical protein PHC86_02200 [Eubacteriales bacterium]|nr:hypothetical protein [Eubacteriales bacterium]
MSLFRKKYKPFEPPMHIDKHWPIYRENVFVDKKPHRFPFWFAPLAALVAIVLIVFYLAPTITRRVVNLTHNRDLDGQQISRSLDEMNRVVSQTTADLYETADLKAKRLAQVLYNEPVTLTNIQTTYGFRQVILQEGLTGFMREDQLSTYCDSAEPALALNKLVVATSSKRIMSHAKTGTLIAEVMMGTVLYADYRGDGISRVLLPDGQTGWISDEGMVILPPDGEVMPVESGARYFTTSALSFLNVTLINRGMTIDGASIPGIAYVSAAVNGVKLPRLMSEQFMSGEVVVLSRDLESELVDPDILAPGDLLFFGQTPDSSEPTRMAICISETSMLVENQGRSSIRLLDPAKDEVLWSNLIGIRRIFRATP